MKEMKKTTVVLAFVLVILVAFTGTAKKEMIDLEDINYKISANKVGLKLNMDSGNITIKSDSPNYSDTTKLKGDMDYSAIATAGELSQLAKDVDGSMDSITKLDNGKFAVKFKGKGKKIFKQLLMKRVGSGEVSIVVKGDGEGQIIVITPSKRPKRKKRKAPSYTKWEIRMMQLRNRLDISENKAWDIVHEYLLIRTKHALEHTPKTDNEDKARWFFWLYLLEPKFKGGIDNNTVIGRFFHPRTEKALEGLTVNVTLRDLEGQMGVVYASPMPYFEEKKMYIEKLKESDHWLIPPEKLEAGEYMLHIDVGDDLRKFVKIPVMITNKGNIVEKGPKGDVNVELKREDGEIQEIKVSFANSSKKGMKLTPMMQLLKDGKLLKNIKLKSFSVDSGEELSNEIPIDAVFGASLKEGSYTVKLMFQTDDEKVINTEGKFKVSE